MVKKGLDKGVDFLRKDIFAIIWIIFIVVIIYLTFFGKEYVKEMIVVRIMFLAIFLLHPIVRMAHGSKITKFISGGKYVPAWKRFPIFFLAILLIFAIKHFLELGLAHTFTTDSVNIILVVFWLIALFSIYYLIFSQGAEEKKERFSKTRNVRYNRR
ncbi:hypothetical protein [[Eubacterium] cellulosolvens]